MVHEKLVDNDNQEFINKIINFIFKESSNFKKNILLLQKFIFYLKKHNINLYNELIEYLIKNNLVLENNLKLIVLELLNNNIKLDDDILKFIRIYCNLHNIDYLGLIQEKYCKYNANKVINDIDLYLSEIRKYKILTKEEEKELVIKMQNGDLSAREQLIKCNLRLVVTIARKYLHSVVGLDMLDLIQEGNKGLIKALDKYDIKFDSRISTYATIWIRQYIRRGIENYARNIRIPNDVLNLLRMYKNTEEDIFKKTGTIPTYKEIAKEMGIPITKALQLFKIQQDTISLNTVVDDTENIELGEFVLATESSAEEVYLKEHGEEEFLNYIKKCNLTERELETLILRFGFLGNTPHTLEEIGKIYGVTRERIRQIEKNFLKKINESANLKEMLVYGSTPR